MKNAIANALSNHNSSTTASDITNAPKPSAAFRKRRNVLSMTLGLAALAFMTITTSAQVTWEPPATQYGTGYAPRIAADGLTVVEVHQLDSGSGPLEYRTGTIGPSGVVTWRAVHKYDTGSAPTVAISGTNVVEMHQGTGNDLIYRIGVLKPAGTITWAAGVTFDHGFAPSVAMSGPEVVEVHQDTQSSPANLYMSAAQLSSGTLGFSFAFNYTSGVAPDVALSGGTIIEVHEAGGSSNTLFYEAGTVGASNALDFPVNGGVVEAGYSPSVTIAGPTIIEVHTASPGVSGEWGGTGLLQNDGTVLWQTTTNYDTGSLPSVATAGPDVVEVHQGTSPALWSDIGQF